VTTGGVITSEPVESRRTDLVRNATVALAVLLSVLTGIRYGLNAETGLFIVFVCVLVAIARIDAQSRVIPNRIVLPAWGVILLAHLALRPGHWVEWLVGSFGAGLLFFALVLVYPAGMGLGDAKLALLIGAALGYAALTALLLGTLASGLVAIALLLKEGSSARKRSIPLGPFLAAGAIIALLFF
jgi:leader peptidase (prepilin peptidase) / N-methyltransferase